MIPVGLFPLRVFPDSVILISEMQNMDTAKDFVCGTNKWVWFIFLVFPYPVRPKPFLILDLAAWTVSPVGV